MRTLSPLLVRQPGIALAAIVAVFCQPAWAEGIYKCQHAGKTVYTSDPASSSGCQPVDLKVIEPNPLDVSRAVQEKQRKAAEEEAAEQKAREERLARAKEIEAQAALRRARAAEEELRLLKRHQEVIANPPVYPYWGIGIPHLHPRLHDGHRPRGRSGGSSPGPGKKAAAPSVPAPAISPARKR